MDIYQALTADHDKLKPLLDQLVEATEHSGDTKRLLDQIKDELVVHARAEEAVFYNSLRESEQGKGEAMHGYKEHAEAEALLQTLRGLKAINIEWKKAAEKLRDALNHHIEEEEGEMFARGRQVFFDQEADQMGEAFLRMKPEIEARSDFQNTLELVANLMPRRFAQPLRRFSPQS